MTEPEKTHRSWATGLGQAPIQPFVRTYRRSTGASAWHGLPSISTAIRVRKSRSELESKLRQELRSYVNLGHNWDGDGARAPSEEAVNDALTFLDGRPDDIPLPYPEEGVDGDVGVYWDNGQAQVFVEVSFEGDGTCAYFAVQGVPGAVTEKCGDDGLGVANPWPDDLLRILRAQNSN